MITRNREDWTGKGLSAADRLQGGHSFLCLLEVADIRAQAGDRWQWLRNCLLLPNYTAFRTRRVRVSGSIWVMTMINFHPSPLPISDWAPEIRAAEVVCNLLAHAYLVRVHCSSCFSPPLSSFHSSVHPLKDLICALRKNSRWNKIMPRRRKDGIMDILWTQIFFITLWL